MFSRKIVRRFLESTLGTEALPLQALDMAPWNVSDDLTGLVNRSDSGSSYVSLAHTARIIELGGTRSVGPKGDSFESVVT